MTSVRPRLPRIICVQPAETGALCFCRACDAFVSSEWWSRIRGLPLGAPPLGSAPCFWLVGAWRRAAKSHFRLRHAFPCQEVLTVGPRSVVLRFRLWLFDSCVLL